VLIGGESGTGKSMLARTLHQCSSRSSAPFVVVNCGALPESLLESELFGHAKGSFTGAVSDKIGKFEAADGGTIFLDEIACASLELQVKLLRVLQDRVFERVGDHTTRKTDARVIAASNRDLRDEVREGRFREDLYYRIKVVSLEMPPLRDRPGDVPMLAEHFLRKFAAEYGRPVKSLTPDCLAALTAHSWPGNVRELEHCLERAVLLSSSSALTAENLSPDLREHLPATPPDNPDSGSRVEAHGGEPSTTAGSPEAQAELQAIPGALDGLESPPSAEAGDEPGGVRPLREALEGPERLLIQRALELCGGNRNRTASLLEINRSTLFNKMKKYNLMEFSPGRS
jgi:DNA-binding NtrC family response regulator